TDASLSAPPEPASYGQGPNGRDPRRSLDPNVGHGCLHLPVGASSILREPPVRGGSRAILGMGKGGGGMADVAYCMKWREKGEFTGWVVTLKNGRPALQGTCPVCGTKLTKILGMDAAKAMGWKAP